MTHSVGKEEEEEEEAAARVSGMYLQDLQGGDFVLEHFLGFVEV